MKKLYTIGIGALIIGLIVGVFFCPCEPKIAVIDVNKVAASYPKLSLVKRENTLRIGELSQWLEATQKQIDAEKNKEKKADMIKHTQALAQQKKAAIQQEHSQKTIEISNEITDIITKVAKKNGYKIVFSKTSVITGGNDITEKVLEKFKENKN